MKIQPILPFDGEMLLAWLGKRAIPGVEVVEGNVYARANTRVTVAGDSIVTNNESARVRRLFDVDADPREIAAVLRKDPMLRTLLARLPGIRVPGAWDVFELCARAVVGQQVSVAGARTTLGRLAAQHGLNATALADADIQGMPRKRAETLRTLARAVASGAIDPVRDDLTQLAGIGPWTANYIRMRLGDRDAFPAGDLILRRKAGDLTEKSLLQRAETWRPYRAYAAMLLWNG